MKALIISTDLFEDSELQVPYQELQGSGIDVDIASLKKGTICGKHGWCIDATLTLDEVDPQSYDIVILPGGKAPAVLRKDPKVLQIVQHFFAQGKPVAAICHGPQILISAGLLKGKVATGYKSIADELKNAGAVYKDETVVVDGNLITSRQPSDLKAFMKTIREHLNKKNL